MRFIDLSELEKQGKKAPGEVDWPSKQWKKRAKEAYDAVKHLSDDMRNSNAFKAYSDVWGMLKEDFRLISHDKCWYCEALIDTDRGEMDHFRPKGRVTGIPDHPGYWWLAFEWHNFRFACGTCNSGNPDPQSTEKGGKGNHFPLVGGEGQRVKAEHTYEHHWCEFPQLLDPTNPSDPGLLTFGLDGKPRPSRQNEVDYKRAQISIKTYQLDHSTKNRKRRNDIYFPMKERIETIKRDKEAYSQDSMNYILRAKIEENVLELRRMIRPQAAYSAAANAFLKRYRYLDWIDEILTGSR